MNLDPLLQSVFNELSGSHLLVDEDLQCLCITAEAAAALCLSPGDQWSNLNEDSIITKKEIKVHDRKYFLVEINDEPNFMRQSLDRMPAAVYTKSAQGRYFYANKEFYDVVPNCDDAIGKTDLSIFPLDVASQIMKNDSEIISSGEVKYFEETVPHPDGSMRTYDTYKFPLADSGGNIFALTGISIDMTARRKLQTEVETQRMLAVQAAKMASLGEMAGGISHEINTPLTVISGNAYKILREMKSSQPPYKSIESASHSIIKMTERITQIMHGLRGFTRNADQDPFSIVSMEKLIHESLDMCMSRLKTSNVQVEVEADAAIQFSCRPAQIMQVLVNLLSNAVDAVADDGSGKILINVKESGNGLSVSVEDNGHGVAAEIEERIFEPFFTTKPAGKGTGLGLSISRSIVKSHGGILGVKSCFPGTIFEAHFPAYLNETQIEL